MSSSIRLQPNAVWHDHVKKVAQVANWSVSLSVTDSSAGALLTASKGPYSVESGWRWEDYFSAGIVAFKCMRTILRFNVGPIYGRWWSHPATEDLHIRIDVPQAQNHRLLSLPLYLICSLSLKLLLSLIKQEADGQLEAQVSIQARRATEKSWDARASAY